MYSNKVNCNFSHKINQPTSTTNEPFTQVKENNANTFRTWNGPPKFCIALEADWLIILDEVRRKSPGDVRLVIGGSINIFLVFPFLCIFVLFCFFQYCYNYGVEC